MKRQVTTGDVISTALARAYMNTPKHIRKYIKPFVKQGVHIERSAVKAKNTGTKQLRAIITTKTQKVLGFSQRFAANIGIKSKKGKKP